MAILGENLDTAQSFNDIGAVGVRSGRPRSVHVTEDYFDDLGVEQAYWLGFIYADGCVIWTDSAGRSRWVLTINLKPDDTDHLFKLHAALGGSFKVGKAARLNAHSRYLCARLGSLGVVPRKSYAPCAPPPMRGEVLRSFLRGMFDGDGCLHETKKGYLQAAFCGHPAIVRWFVEKVGVSGSEHLRDGTLYYQWSGGRQARALIRNLYPGTPSLDRKAAIAARWI